MTVTAELPIPSAADREMLRHLARQCRDLCHTPKAEERRAAWLALHDGPSPIRPLILIEDAGVMDARRPFDPALSAGHEALRAVERNLRYRLWRSNTIDDDDVPVPHYDLAWRIHFGDYGVHATHHTADNDGHLSARRWDPALANLDADLDRLQPCQPSVDREGALAHRAWVDDLLGDILPTRLRGLPFWTLGLTIETIHLIGLEEFMLAMHDHPDGLHRLLSFQCDQWMRRLDWLEAEKLVCWNNENDYIGSGSRGWFGLPAGHSPGQAPALSDLWVLSESQETVGVGPGMFGEFIFPYQKRLADRFGRLYYGCCEPVHNRWDILKGFGNLRAVSVSPWCDEDFMADACARAGIVYSRKPNPTLISTAIFDEDAIRADARHTARLAARAGAGLEIIMKDVHTLHNEPDRLRRWVALAREAIQ